MPKTERKLSHEEFTLRAVKNFAVSIRAFTLIIQASIRPSVCTLTKIL